MEEAAQEKVGWTFGLKKNATQALDGGAPQDPKTMPIRQYLDRSVVPILLQGMAALVKER